MLVHIAASFFNNVFVLSAGKNCFRVVHYEAYEKADPQKEGMDIMREGKETILVLDFGSQYSQLIARRIREANVYSRIVPWKISAKDLLAEKPMGIILSGGPASRSFADIFQGTIRL